jgi:hypothetical protein
VGAGLCNRILVISAQNCPKWSKMVQNDQKLSKIIKNGPKLPKIVQKGLKMAQNGPK